MSRLKYFDENYTDKQAQKDLMNYIDSDEFTDKDYIDLFNGEYEDLDPNTKYAHLSPLSVPLQQALLKSKHNNNKTNDRVLDAILSKKDSESGNRKRRLEESQRTVLSHFKLGKKTLKEALIGEHPKYQYQAGFAPDKEGFQREIMGRKDVSKNPKEFIHHLINNNKHDIIYNDHTHFIDKMDEEDIKSLLNHKKTLSENDSYPKNKIDSTVTSWLANHANKNEGQVPSNIVRHVLEDHRSLNSVEGSTREKILDSLEPSERKRLIDKAIGLEGHELYRKPEDVVENRNEENMQIFNKEHNWDNLSKRGEGLDNNLSRYFAGSKYLDDEQADFIKRHHDNVHTKMALFENPHIDPKHGVEMYNKWANDDSEHDYGTEGYNDYQRKYNQLYDVDSLPEETMNQIREEIQDDGDYYDATNEDFDDWLRSADAEDSLREHWDREVDRNQEDHEDDIHRIMEDNYDDWKAENPNSKHNIGNPGFDALDEWHKQTEGDTGWNDVKDLERYGIDEKMLKQLGIELDDSGDVDGDHLMAKLNEYGGPSEIDYANHDDFGIHNHPEYDSRFDEARDEYITDKINNAETGDSTDGLWEDWYGSEHYMDREREALDYAVRNAAEEKVRDLYDNAHLDERSIPTHLHEHLPIQEMKQKRIRNMADGANSSFLNKHIPNRVYEHQYGPDLHHHEMIQELAEHNNGSIDIGRMNKMHPNLKDKWQKIFNGKGKLSSQEIQEKIDQIPKRNFDITFGKWNSNQMQNVNGQDQVVFRLDHSADSLKPLQEDPETFNIFKKMQETSKRSGHPTNKSTIAWGRVDTSDPKAWHLDELQSDFGKAAINYLKNEGHGDKAEHIQKIADYHGNWRENLLNHIIKTAKKHGVERITTHSPESKAQHTGSNNVHSVYEGSYKKVPRQMGFKPVSGDKLPLTERGKNNITDENGNLHSGHELNLTIPQIKKTLEYVEDLIKYEQMVAEDPNKNLFARLNKIKQLRDFFN